MKLKNAAKYFDQLVLVDAYDSSFEVKGQFDLYDDSRRDGMSVERRILSVAPATTMPPRRTLQADGLTWLVGDSQNDYYKNEPIRNKYVVHLASELTALKTFAEVLGSAAGYSVWATRSWVKGAKEIDISSLIVDVYDVYFSGAETIARNQMLNLDGRWHIVRNTHQATAGFHVATCDELPEPVVTTATFTDRAYVVATDSYTETPSTKPVLRLHWQSYFDYEVTSAEKFKIGDIVIIVLKSDATVTEGDRVAVDGNTYNALAVKDGGTTWEAHLRHA